MRPRAPRARPACSPRRRSPPSRRTSPFALAYLDDELQSCTPGAPRAAGRAPPELVKSSPSSSSSRRARRGRLVVGLNPRRPFDDHYRAFLDLVADQLGTALANARAYEEERQRAEALGRTRSRQDGVLQQRQPRVPDAADAAARPARRRPGRCRTPWRPCIGNALEVAHRNALAAAAARQHAAGFLAHRSRPHRRQLRADRSRALDRASWRACSDRRSKRRGSRSSSTAIRCPSRSTSIATCGRRSS